MTRQLIPAFTEEGLLYRRLTQRAAAALREVDRSSRLASAGISRGPEFDLVRDYALAVRCPSR